MEGIAVFKRVNPQELQKAVCELARRVIRSKAFDGAKIRRKFWQVLIDGTGIVASRTELDGNYIFRVYHKGTEQEYVEYEYYLFERIILL